MKCLDCDYMACKEYAVKTELWTGFCLRLRQKVNGNNECHAAESIIKI